MNTAFVFSGQGPFWPETGKDLFKKEQVFRHVIEECEYLIKRIGGWSLKDTLFLSKSDAKIDNTAIAQPAYFAFQVALFTLLQKKGFEPAAVIGHSTGEVAAAYCAGVMNLEDSIKVIYHRGRLMERLTGKGRMLWAKLFYEEAKKILVEYPGQEKVSICAVNEPSSTVFSGEVESIKNFYYYLLDLEIGAIELSFNYGFHCYLVDDLCPELVSSLRGIKASSHEIPIVSTVEGTFLDGERFGEDYWSANIRNTVLFRFGIEALIEEGINNFVEISPRPLLLGSIDECLGYKDVEGLTLPTLDKGFNDFDVLNKSLKVLQTLAK
ncbi:MAG: acyltransferase domain-containing protein [Bacteroidia bacterium]|nr:acyltransferase domain-containing protein [Bacteroidia bacterium]